MDVGLLSADSFLNMAREVVALRYYEGIEDPDRARFRKDYRVEKSTPLLNFPEIGEVTRIRVGRESNLIGVSFSNSDISFLIRPRGEERFENDRYNMTLVVKNEPYAEPVLSAVGQRDANGRGL